MNVLSIGQCGFDHASISSLLRKEFDCEVVAAATMDEALRAIAKSPPELVLVNRKLDLDYSDGLEIIRTLKAEPKTASLPVMLVSNYPEYQQQAVAIGAVEGFGKSDLGKPTTIEKLRPFLKS